MDNRESLILLLLIFFLFAAPDPRPPSRSGEDHLQRQKEEKQRTLELIKNSKYGDFNTDAGKWLPLAGLTQADGFAWGLLGPVQNKARAHQLAARQQGSNQQQSTSSQQPLNFSDTSFPIYRHVTGKLRGSWMRWKGTGATQAPRLNFTLVAGKHDYGSSVHGFSHNITVDHGTLQLNLHEPLIGETVKIGGDTVREITADMIVEGDQQPWGESWIVSLFGVHFPEMGAMTLSTTSEKFAALAALPHLALSSESFELSRRLVNKSLSDTLSDQRNGPSGLFPWSLLPHGSAATFSSPKCEYIMYIQQSPVMADGGTVKDGVLQMIEDELHHPRGAPIPNPPPMAMSATIFSPDCGFVLETKGSSAGPADYPYISGVKQEEYNKYAGRFITLVAGVLAIHVALLMRQVKEASTPSTRSRVSFYTVSMMSMGDAIFVCLIVLELCAEASSLLLTATCFMAFFSVGFLGMKFQIEIWNVQASERTESVYTPTTRTGERSPRSLLLPVTAPEAGLGSNNNSPSPNIPARSSQSEYLTEIDAGTMYSRFYLVLFLLLFFSSWTLFWPPRLRSVYVSALSLIYFSFWTPQIFRNIMRNCRKSLQWEFIIGESLLRGFPVLYFYYVPRNVLFVTISSTSVVMPCIWVLIQGVFLVSQDILGARLFIPKNWVPPAYDYHPILRDNQSEKSVEEPEPAGTLPITSLRAEERQLPTDSNDSKQADKRRKRVYDCAICMQGIEVSVLLVSSKSRSVGPGLGESTTNLLSRRAYMVTPCQHIFHSTCLEGWMRLRLQCPICRETVPPI